MNTFTDSLLSKVDRFSRKGVIGMLIDGVAKHITPQITAQAYPMCGCADCGIILGCDAVGCCYNNNGVWHTGRWTLKLLWNYYMCVQCWNYPERCVSHCNPPGIQCC